MSSNVRAGVRIVLVASLSGSWRSGITEVFSAIASGVETLIHPKRDLAAGDFIMQMSVSAPVPATVLKRTRGHAAGRTRMGWQRSPIHHCRHHRSHLLISCSYPLSLG